MNKMTKSEVYSWRLSAKLKADLERAAKAENASVGAVLERLAREWLSTREPSPQEHAALQRRLHARALKAIGKASVDAPSATNEEVRRVMGEFLEAKYRASQRGAPRRSD
jgi:hypothetical protein